METIILILQSLIAFIFIFSGINKFYFDSKTKSEDKGIIELKPSTIG